MEKVGYINKGNLSLTNGLNSIDELKDVKIEYGNRDAVEERNDVVQPICAGVIITKSEQILVINKNKKATSKISPEKDKTLLYIGGHLDISDTSTSNLHTFANGMKREVSEELGIEIKDASVGNPISTYTPVSEKSARHLGVIFPIIIEKSFDTTFTDGKCKFVEISDLKNITNFETWSEIILKEIVEKIHLGKTQKDEELDDEN